MHVSGIKSVFIFLEVNFTQILNKISLKVVKFRSVLLSGLRLFGYQFSVYSWTGTGSIKK